MFPIGTPALARPFHLRVMRATAIWMDCGVRETLPTPRFDAVLEERKQSMESDELERTELRRIWRDTARGQWTQARWRV